jgi:pyridoxamine 5'-phosphate oxidase
MNPASEPPARRIVSISNLDPDPLVELAHRMREAVAAGDPEPHAMTLATVSPDGAPSARLVLLRGLHPEGLVFYTNYRSRKGREIEANPRVALVIHWPEAGRQARVEGDASRLPESDSDRYFAGRPMGSRLGAIVSPQSEVLEPDRDLRRDAIELARRLRRERERPRRPAHWGGYLVRPRVVELWQAGRNRLHDRFRYRRTPAGWAIERLAP